MDEREITFRLTPENSDVTALVCKALSSEVRLKILSLLPGTPKNISDLANALNIPMSTMTTHIRLLEEAKLISVTSSPGSRGMQKRCGSIVNKILLSFSMDDLPQKPASSLLTEEEMPVGNYFDYEVTAPCGMVSDKEELIPNDNPSRFSSPERVRAQLIWLTTGYLEYRFPLDATHPFQTALERIEFSFEICSETYCYNEFWRSDVSIWINDQEIGYIECPGDHGGRHGLFSPEWWSDGLTQYGDLARIILTQNGCTLNAYTTDKHTITSLRIGEKPYISLKIGVKENARYAGGMNLFGEKFGDHAHSIIMRIYGHPISAEQQTNEERNNSKNETN